MLGFVPSDLLLCVLLGLVCGLLGAVFVFLISRFCAARNRWVSRADKKEEEATRRDRHSPTRL